MARTARGQAVIGRDRPSPLGDIRVIDLTVAGAGPTCVRQLADWGADVVRVEPPPDVAGPARARKPAWL